MLSDLGHGDAIMHKSNGKHHASTLRTGEIPPCLQLFKGLETMKPPHWPFHPDLAIGPQSSPLHLLFEGLGKKKPSSKVFWEHNLLH